MEKLEHVKHAESHGRNSTFVDAPAAPSYPSQGRVQLTFTSLPPLDNLTKEAHADMQVRTFWQHLYIVPLVDVATEIGVTWLELFILYAMPGSNAIPPVDSKRHLRQTHAAGLRAFISRSRALFRFATDDVKPLIRPHLVRHAGNQQPLAKYGLLANLSQLPFRLSLGDTILHAALCSYSGRVPTASLIPTRLRSARFKSPRFSPWAHLATS